ncbi:MAG: site-2 protease family protein [Spirochaetaceae bacterium]|jgi:membrane-associated protease RseP (regulator of RpoE activity)|nr:site-2 protease family protein [Spirochaetaceae bacterium]
MTGLKIILGLIGLGIVVFVHELGHFIAARLAGIDVEAFSIGWGKPILKKKIGTVEYRLGLFPLGGYCKMRGESDYKVIWDNKKNGIEPEPGTFFAAKPWKRIIAAFAGPLFNFFFAILALSVIWGRGKEVETLENRIVLVADIDGQSYPSDKSGLLTGDRIITINGKQINNYRDMQENIALNPDKDLSLTVLRDSRQHDLAIRPTLDKSGAGKIGVYPWVTPTVQAVRAGSPAEKALLQPGDRILGIQQQTPVGGSDEAASQETLLGDSDDFTSQEMLLGDSDEVASQEALLGGSDEATSQETLLGDSDDFTSQETLAGEEIAYEELPYTVAFLRIFKDKQPENFSLIFEREGITQTAEFRNITFISGQPDLGIEYPSVRFKTPALSFPAAVAAGCREAVKTFAISAKSLGLLFKKNIDHIQAVSGPARITYMLGNYAVDGFAKDAATGFVYALNFLALISIALCLMNLLPLPILDGGMIILYLVEMIKRGPIHPKAVSVFQTAGMVIIFGLMIFAAFSDVLFFIGR